MKIDLKKYKRIFAFGCSFTAYGWPTWADIIAVEAKTEYYNYGVSGLGNLGIMARIAEANARYKFNEDDLVMVMWSTYSREDRWINGGWYAMGNVWNSGYPDNWVRDYCDPVGYLIRDHAIISLTNKMLKESKAGSIILRSVPFNFSEGIEAINPEIETTLSLLYQRDYDELPMSLYDFMGRDWRSDTVNYIRDDGKENSDPHPKPIIYYNYLESCVGLTFSKSTNDYANDATNKLVQCKTVHDIRQNFDQPVRDLLSKNFRPLI
jgi:hypothetical protein